MVFKAGKDDADYVKADQDQREVARGPMEIIDPFNAPE